MQVFVCAYSTSMYILPAIQGVFLVLHFSFFVFRFVIVLCGALCRFCFSTFLYQISK